MFVIQFCDPFFFHIHTHRPLPNAPLRKTHLTPLPDPLRKEKLTTTVLQDFA